MFRYPTFDDFLSAVLNLHFEIMVLKGLNSNNHIPLFIPFYEFCKVKHKMPGK